MPMQVFDGHNGTSAAQFAAEHMAQFLLSDSSFSNKPSVALVRLCPKIANTPALSLKALTAVVNAGCYHVSCNPYWARILTFNPAVLRC